MASLKEPEFPSLLHLYGWQGFTATFNGPSVITRWIPWLVLPVSMAEEWRVMKQSRRSSLSTSNSIIQVWEAEQRRGERGQSGPVSSHWRHQSHPDVPSARHTCSLKKLPSEGLSSVLASICELCSPSSTRSGFYSSDLLSSGPFVHVACHLHDNTWPNQSAIKTVRGGKKGSCLM